TTPATTDILEFTDGNTYSVTGVPTQTIRQLFVNGSTNVSLVSGTAAILNIIGPTLTNNIVVASGATLQLSGVGAYSLTLAMVTTASQRADISGNLIINANN